MITILFDLSADNNFIEDDEVNILDTKKIACGLLYIKRLALKNI